MPKERLLGLPLLLSRRGIRSIRIIRVLGITRAIRLSWSRRRVVVGVFVAVHKVRETYPHLLPHASHLSYMLPVSVYLPSNNLNNLILMTVITLKYLPGILESG